MEEKRAITKNEFIKHGYDTADYHFIEETGTFQARLDLKVWGKRWLVCFFTLSDGRKILACTFPEVNYLGIAEIPIGSELTLTFEKAVRSKRIYLMSTEQLSVFRMVAKSRVANPEIVKKRTESFADSAAEWTEQPHAQLYLPASPSPDPFHISAFPG